MKDLDISTWETSEERARRVNAQKGQCFNQTKDTAARWAERERAIVRFARSMGVDLNPDHERRQNANLLR